MDIAIAIPIGNATAKHFGQRFANMVIASFVLSKLSPALSLNVAPPGHSADAV
jgi:hypothetical protein